VLARLVAGDGNRTVALMSLDDSYGNSLRDLVRTELEEDGVRVVGSLAYDPAGEPSTASYAIYSIQPDGSLEPERLWRVQADDSLTTFRTEEVPLP
jgi:hypothetical protein